MSDMTASTFHNIANFRDVGESVNKYRQQTLLRTELLFRSARPDEATETDRKRLVEEYGVKTIVDLRTRTEHINAAQRRSRTAALAGPAAASKSDELSADTVKIPGIDYAEVNLNGKGFERSLIWQLSYVSLAKVVGYMAFGYRMEAVKIIAKEVLQVRGLIGLGIDTLEHSKPEIKELFDLLADRGSWPVLIHCTKGKDRTGLSVLLILLLCGVDVDSITHDYVRTEQEGDADTEDHNTIGLDESFGKCPKDFVPRIKAHLDEQYGSLEKYLLEIGVEKEQIQDIRSILCAREGP